MKDRLEDELDPRVPKDYLTQNLIGNFHQMLAMTVEIGSPAQEDLRFALLVLSLHTEDRLDDLDLQRR